MIDPRDVIRRHTVEDLCATAEEYYRIIDDPSPLMSKPFSFLHETPEMLQNLGLLLAGLQLGKTMTVLDFGGGTGWLSRFLAQLNCSPICCDPSPTALRIAQRLFDELPLVGTAVHRPTFLQFDGHRIGLPDESVDRIVCFDAFHHVPNQQEVLSEFGRVLKQGGIAGFSEPGRNHSGTPQSQYEMATHRVLENDIDVADIARLGRPAGFTKASVKAILDRDVSLDDLAVLFDTSSGERHEALKSDLWNSAHNTMTNRAIFFLQKGDPRRDSRSHIGLAHRLTIAQSHLSCKVSHKLAIPFEAANTGSAAWLHTNSEIFGVVRIATHLYQTNGSLVTVDFTRHDLPRDILPGESVIGIAEISFASPGDYHVVFDLVSEGVSWFENLGSEPVTVSVAVR